MSALQNENISVKQRGVERIEFRGLSKPAVVSKPAVAPVIWSRVPETALTPRQLYRAFLCENVVSPGRVKVFPTWLFITVHWIIRCTDIPLSLSFPGSFARIAESILTSLIWIPASNPKFRHYSTLDTSRVVPVRRAKAGLYDWRKVAPLTRVTQPGEVIETTRPPELPRLSLLRRAQRPLLCCFDRTGFLAVGLGRGKKGSARGMPGGRYTHRKKNNP